MAERWLRWYDGTCRDGKLQLVAIEAETTAAEIIGVWASLLEDASTSEPRGIATKGLDYHSRYLGINEFAVETIWNALERYGTVGTERNAKNEITSVIILNWDKRQYETDDKDPTAKRRKDKWKHTHNWNGTLRNAQERSGTPETETETETETEVRVRAVKNRTTEFEEFWKSKPRRKGANPRSPALKAFGRVVKSGCDPGEIIAAAKKWAAECAEPTEFIPMAVTWLNQRRFEEYKATPEEIEKEKKIAAFMATKGMEWVDGKGWINMEESNA